jgi:DMSO/TMAO reductase YedYZ heme-binding membrane subunit
MYAGAFVQGGYLAKKFMPVRAQLSILGGILAIGHGIALGQNFLKNLDFSVGFLISLLLLIVMVPLFITSFLFIRKKMKPKTWKRLQQMAYLFYFLTFAHILVFEMPKALRGVKGYPLNVFVYFVVFVSYLFCRIFRAVYKNAKEMMVRAQVISTAAVLFVAISGSLSAGLLRTGSDEPEVLGEKREEREESEGVFYGEGMGNNGKIGVNVTVLNGEITDIEIVKFPDDADYFDVEKDGSKMIQQMIESQNPEVDTVSGATFSSEGLIDAVGEALRNAEIGE